MDLTSEFLLLSKSESVKRVSVCASVHLIDFLLMQTLSGSGLDIRVSTNIPTLSDKTSGKRESV